MSNSDIARHFRELALLMELHRDNPFKIRSYTKAYNLLRKSDQPLSDLSEQELQQLEGVGKAIAAKIHELATTGTMATLEKWREQTPAGIREMLSVRGFGPKKVKAVWDGLGVTSIGQLLYAINENRLVELKGFGAKTQATLKEKLEFHQRSQGQFLFRELDEVADAFRLALQRHFPDERIERSGALRRCCPTLPRVEFISTISSAAISAEDYGALPGASDLESSELRTSGTIDAYPFVIHHVAAENFGSNQFKFTGATEFLEAFVQRMPDQDFSNLATEQEVFDLAGLSYLEPELREDGKWLEAASNDTLPKLLKQEDIRGVVHSHSTYSDGINSLREMAEATRDKGYSYLVISDHSKSAFYAGGLSIERVQEQWAEIDRLNEELAPFHIYKSIESDILADGSLDYPDDILAGFDLVIASVHSGLDMSEEKATERLITAIRNPYTTVLGHPTGRLLLSRAGYPIDHRRVIDACADHQVVLELNANPYRLDVDWTWIAYAMERGVPVSINPDAHSVGGVDDIRYGVLAARKGGLTVAGCWNVSNSLPLDTLGGGAEN